MVDFSVPLIDVASLAAMCATGGAEAPLVIDCRFDLAQTEGGRREYLEAHVPGAVYAHLDRDLSEPRGGAGGRHPLPSPEYLARRLASLGVNGSSRVVAYDHVNGAFASRLWWLLRYMNHQAVTVLDGGFAAWRAAGRPVESGQREPVAGDFVGVAQPGMLVEAGAVLGARCLIDSRDGARYRGEHEPLDPVAGHIPGAVNRFFGDNLDSGGRFRSADAIRGEFEDLLGGCPPGDAVVYCGSGVTACHNLLAMSLAGLPMARLYAGSWSEWCQDSSRPVARGTSPQGS